MDEDDGNIGQRETAAKLGGTLEYNSGQTTDGNCPKCGAMVEP